MNMKLEYVIHTAIAVVCLGLWPTPNGFGVSPAPDGCYPNFTTAEGCNALNFLTSGAGNTGVGWRSLFSNTTANFNTGVGAGTLLLNTGDSNTALGAAALLLNTTATQNTAVGTAALLSNDSDSMGLGNNNTAVGGTALQSNVDGSENTALGTGAGQNIVNGFNNTYVGDFVGTLVPDESNTIRIGDLSNGNGAGSLACFIGGIFNNFQPVGGSVVEVTLDLATDELGWDIGPSHGGGVPGARVPRSAPQPRAFRAMPNGKVGRVEKLEATVAQQQKRIETLTAQLKEQADTFTAQLKEQAAQIQKVSAQVEMGKPSPQIVVTN
jgi:uncharacterized coiled-coil protein SlyX